jgi:uncharacterized protein (TIGR02117 family)
MYIECRETQMKRALKIIAGVFSAVILFILLYLISDAVLSRIVISAHAEPGARAPAYIRTDGFHSDFVLPVRYAGVDFPEEFKLLNGLEKNPSVRYIAFGWGDRDFYMETSGWDGVTPRRVFNAAFGFGHSVMHIAYYGTLPDDAKRLNLSAGQYRRLVKYIRDSFRRNSAGEAVRIDEHPDRLANDAFFESVGRYSIFNTCNTWLDRGLKKCGARACVWTPFETGIFRLY